jgi:hypothetical protein
VTKLLALSTGAIAAALVATLAALPVGGLTESARLAAVYDAILHARLDHARALLAESCPPAPEEACLALSEVALWWQIQQDPENPAFDEQLEESAGRAIDAADEWTEREPERAEAWFYLAASYAPLTEWRVLRGERLSAARDGKRIKDALERTLALDPTIKDAFFGIGLYHYYADVAPAALKFLRFLLLMPGGDREAGLREMLTTRDQGVLLGGEADFQLHYLYLWYEHEPGRALELLRGLDARYPTNPVFLGRIAEVHRDYLHDRAASQRAWRELLDRAESGDVEFAPIAEARARLGLAGDLIALSEPARAIAIVTPVVERGATAPYGAQALAQLLLGTAQARLGDNERATRALDRAQALAPEGDPDDIRTRARQALTRVRAQAK